MGKLSTGIDILDTRLDGGFPEGSVVTLIADPKSTAELFLYDLASTRRTHYVTTARTEENIVRNLQQLNRDPSDINVVDITSAEDSDEVDEIVSGMLKEVGPEDNMIFDTFSDFPNRYGEYNDLLNRVYATSHRNANITYLYMIQDADDVLSYDESRVPYMSDIVVRMISSIAGEKVENRLAITKLRGEEPPEKTIKLEIGTSIEIDTSRDIA
ncbi:MAG: RAD55 family ATPase [Halobacteria archaeon]|nr:RAD55 family ATPase [Halobacteria archaeon]